MSNSNTHGSVRALNACSLHAMRAVGVYVFWWKDYSNPVGDSHFGISNCYCWWLFRDFHHNWLNPINNNTVAQTPCAPSLLG